MNMITIERFFKIFVFIHSCLRLWKKHYNLQYKKNLENFNNIKQEKLFPINKEKKSIILQDRKKKHKIN
jgi:hypothetical protein